LNPSLSTNSGNYVIYFSIRDGYTDIGFSIKITVINLNLPPSFSPSLSSSISVVTGHTFTYNLPSFTDPEGATLTFSLLGTSTIVSLASNILTFLPPVLTSAGSHIIFLIISDGISDGNNRLIPLNF
jgi:hypothetical protein